MVHYPAPQGTCSTWLHLGQQPLASCSWIVWMGFAFHQSTRNDKRCLMHQQWWNHLALAPIYSKSWSLSLVSQQAWIWIRNSNRKTVFLHDPYKRVGSRWPMHDMYSWDCKASHLFWLGHSSAKTKHHCRPVYSTCSSWSQGLAARTRPHSAGYEGWKTLD